jgi:hypothetical protein
MYVGGVAVSGRQQMGYFMVKCFSQYLSGAGYGVSPTNHDVIYILTGDGDPDPLKIVPISNMKYQALVSPIYRWWIYMVPTNFSFDHPSILVPIKLLIHPPIQYSICGSRWLISTTNNWSTWAIGLNNNL